MRLDTPVPPRRNAPRQTMCRTPFHLTRAHHVLRDTRVGPTRRARSVLFFCYTYNTTNPQAQHIRATPVSECGRISCSRERQRARARARARERSTVRAQVPRLRGDCPIARPSAAMGRKVCASCPQRGRVDPDWIKSVAVVSVCCSPAPTLPLDPPSIALLAPSVMVAYIVT